MCVDFNDLFDLNIEMKLKLIESYECLCIVLIFCLKIRYRYMVKYYFVFLCVSDWYENMDYGFY